jgi:hypothetical protein
MDSWKFWDVASAADYQRAGEGDGGAEE